MGLERYEKCEGTAQGEVTWFREPQWCWCDR